jgi:hypothetical protein
VIKYFLDKKVIRDIMDVELEVVPVKRKRRRIDSGAPERAFMVFFGKLR